MVPIISWYEKGKNFRERRLGDKPRVPNDDPMMVQASCQGSPYLGVAARLASYTEKGKVFPLMWEHEELLCLKIFKKQRIRGDPPKHSNLLVLVTSFLSQN